VLGSPLGEAAERETMPSSPGKRRTPAVAGLLGRGRRPCVRRVVAAGVGVDIGAPSARVPHESRLAKALTKRWVHGRLAATGGARAIAGCIVAQPIAGPCLSSMIPGIYAPRE
jgi:hypothetical protein